MKILMISPEVSPHVKVGGLSDVVGSLPKELVKLGFEVKVVCPAFSSITNREKWVARQDPLFVHLGAMHYAKVWEEAQDDARATYYFIEYDAYFNRPGVYTDAHGEGYPDNDRRAAFLSRAGLDLCRYLNWVPDVIHGHDWMTGFVPLYMNTVDANGPLGDAASVFTIHNLAHQGYANRSVLGFAGLPPDTFRPDCAEAMGGVNMMKAALYNATKITTVSEHYAQEIRTPAYGCGLEDVLRFRGSDLIGVVNGIDTDVWNPSTDRFLPAHYSMENLRGKQTCKRSLQQEMGLVQDDDIPIFAAIARLYDQKGLDLLADRADQIMKEMRVQIVILGSGDPYLENRFVDLSRRYAGRFGTRIGYDARLSHLIEAGADFFVMPSRFEPCGLNQLYSLRYGTPPIVRATGGLVDTVQNYNEQTGEGTGFVFGEATSHALYYAIGWACSTYYDRPEHYRKLQRNGMSQNLSWKESAKKYASIYDWALRARRR